MYKNSGNIRNCSCRILFCHREMACPLQRQTEVTAYFSSKQLLLFVFELQDSLLPSRNGMSATQRQRAVTANLKSKTVRVQK